MFGRNGRCKDIQITEATACRFTDLYFSNIIAIRVPNDCCLSHL